MGMFKAYKFYDKQKKVIAIVPSTDIEFARDAFLYEMRNHEYAINWEGDYDVCTCFGRCKYEDGKGWEEYLVEMGYGDTTISAYRVAYSEYFANCENY